MGIEEEEMLPPDAIKDEPDDDASFTFGSSAGNNGEGDTGASIPGFDIPADGGVEEDRSKKKLPFAKPIPKQFQQQWNEVRNVLPAPPPESPTDGSRRGTDLRKNLPDQGNGFSH
jgi:hypothetical protein